MSEKMRPKDVFEVGETVWCSDLNGYVFSGKLVKAGPIAFRFDPDWRRNPSYRHDQLFKEELQACFVAEKIMERSLIREARSLGIINRRIVELIKAKKG